MSEELEVLLREADRKKAELAEKPELAPEAEEACRERFLYESVYCNNAIEGNQLILEEVERLLKNDEVVAGKSLSDHVSIVGYRDAMLLCDYYVRQDMRISEHEIRKLHYRMLINRQDISGEYRNFNMMIKGHRPTSPEKISYKMLQLVEAKPTEHAHPIETTAFFHLRIEKIHPFADGNGRVGRLLINVMLEQAGYPAVIIKPDDRMEYYQALDAYDGLNGNPQVKPMQVLLAKLVNRRLDELLALQ
ncbi:MAG: Fic family protein [Coriobacteriales bacterium]|jgi:Fic family protein|nr:Fic family protein [Coriobacteriales bacterium]